VACGAGCVTAGATGVEFEGGTACFPTVSVWVSAGGARRPAQLLSGDDGSSRPHYLTTPAPQRKAGFVFVGSVRSTRRAHQVWREFQQICWLSSATDRRDRTIVAAELGCVPVLRGLEWIGDDSDRDEGWADEAASKGRKAAVACLVG
jgi:hypothetical protein